MDYNHNQSHDNQGASLYGVEPEWLLYDGEDSLPPNRLLDALDSLNQISTTINRIGQDDSTNIEDTLHLIVEGAIKVVPETSAVVFTYDLEQDKFRHESRVSAGEDISLVLWDEPRPNGMGRRAIRDRRRVLSYEEADLDIHPVKIDAGAKVVACFPLIVADQIVGALYVYLHEKREFGQLELRMLDNFVNQAAMAIYHTHRVSSVQRDLLRKEEELARLHRAGLLISSRPRLEDTLEAIIQMALEVTSAQYGIFRLVDKTGTLLVTQAISGKYVSTPLMESLRIDEVSIMAWVAKHRRPVLISDLREEPWASMYYPLDPALEMRSELAVPLIGASGRLEGILNLESPHVGAFTEQDSHLLQSLTTQAVIAIQEARLIDALREVSELLLTQPYKQVLVHLADLACDLLNASASAIWMLDHDTLVLKAASGGYDRDKYIPLGNSLIGQAILQRKSIISHDVRTDPSFHRPDLAAAQGWTRALVVPLLAGDDQEPIGAFSVYSVEDSPGRLAESEWDKKVLTILSHYVALAAHNATRQKALREAQNQRTVAETFAALGDIAANLLHQLNNKVGTIPVRVQGIQDKCSDTLETEPYLASNLIEIEKSASDAMSAVRESLSLLHPIHLIPVTVASCIAEAIATVDFPEAIHVKMEGLDDLPPVVAGKQGLTMVFTNLIDNAVSAMGDQGKITIQGSVRGNRVNITVSDTGPGIPLELQNSIFEFNFSRQETKHAGKLGFGLWWVKTLMARLGGSVSVESDGQEGTTFILSLPRVEEVDHNE